MRLLSNATIARAEIAVDAPAAGPVVPIVGADQSGELRDPEVGLDGVEPRRLRRSVDGVNGQPPEQGRERRVVVDVAQVVCPGSRPAGGETPRPPPERVCGGGTRH